MEGAGCCWRGHLTTGVQDDEPSPPTPAETADNSRCWAEDRLKESFRSNVRDVFSEFESDFQTRAVETDFGCNNYNHNEVFVRF